VGPAERNSFPLSPQFHETRVIESSFTVIDYTRPKTSPAATMPSTYLAIAGAYSVDKDSQRYKHCSLTEAELSAETICLFQDKVYSYFQEHGRAFPWRSTDDPYCILVSEIMLQQTQTERVAARYERFIERFPNFSTLAAAPLKEILSAWQGLGYNRRTLNLKKTAGLVLSTLQGRLPSDPKALMNLPGIGKTTACAICAFAFDMPTVFIETNIRTVFIHHFFSDRNGVTDSEIYPLVEKTLDRRAPRMWYYALMDYGVMLKKRFKNLGRRSAHYSKQSPFKGSDRQIRSLILKTLIAHPGMLESDLVITMDKSPDRVTLILDRLHKEGFIEKTDGQLKISGEGLHE
jgi:A/G-specific adenine glycosylase